MKFLLLRSTIWQHYDESRPFITEDLSDFMTPSFYPPLGLQYIASSLEHAGHQAEIIDISVDPDPFNNIKNAIPSADVIGMSVYYNDYQCVADLTDIIHKEDSDIPMFIGGPHCTFLRERALADIPRAEISVAGEGEKVIIDILKYFQGQKQLADIPGIHYRENGKIKKGKPIEIIKDLDSIHFPARHLVQKYDYGKVNNLYPFKPKLTSMITSRGCPFKCKFCARYGNVIDGWGFRQRSAENIIEEIFKITKDHRSVTIVDDNFLVDLKRANKILDTIIDSKLKLNILVEGARVDSASRELYKKMKKANVKLVGYGIESGNQDVLDYYNKGFKLEQARKAVKLGSEMGFITLATFILGAPIETRQHIENTINFACSIPLDVAFFLPLYYQMHSQIWREAVKEGKIRADEYNPPADKSRGLSQFSTKELVDFSNEGSRRFYMRPKYMFGEIYRSLKRRNLKLLYNGLDVLKANSR